MIYLEMSYELLMKKRLVTDVNMVVEMRQMGALIER